MTLTWILKLIVLLVKPTLWNFIHNFYFCHTDLDIYISGLLVSRYPGVELLSNPLGRIVIVNKDKKISEVKAI